jgi:phenylpropionate dioxygenase-like ring-hydroxylating dioxygenase large terminal subunit
MTASGHLTEAWYVAAWSNEVDRSLLSRTLIECPLVLYRKESGEAAAIGELCPHRFAPLSMGKLLGDAVECAYHGLRFDATGKCVHNPHGEGKIPAKMMVPSYPVVERHRLVWVWMGDPAHADASKIPDFSCHDDPELGFVGGMLEMAANYQLITDNLMDLTHGEFVHKGILSTPAIPRSKLETVQNGTTVYANRWMPDDEIQPAHAIIWDGHVPGESCDQWAYMRWDAPAHLLLDVGVTRVGAPRSQGVWIYGTDILTPKDPYNTYYFWGITRSYRTDDPAAGEQWRGFIKAAFDGQDKPIIEAQQRALGRRHMEDMDPVMLSCDGGANRARRVLASLIKEKAAPSPQNPPLQAHRRVVAPSVNPVKPVL